MHPMVTERPHPHVERTPRPLQLVLKWVLVLRFSSFTARD
jgi:hypothetical protein